MPAARRERLATTAGLLAVMIAGFITFAAGLAGSLSFFGQGADEAFRRWADQTLVAGGAIAVAAAAAGVVVAWRAGRPAVRRPGMTVAVLAGAVAVAAGIAAWHARAEPQGKERSALERLAVPPGAAANRLTTGSLPAGEATVAGPSGQGPPVAVRSWRPGDCASLGRALAAWADTGSLHVPGNFTPGSGTPSCLWFATYGGWPVRAEVLGSGAARVVIAPPGVGL